MAYADSTAIIYSGSNHIMQYAYDFIAINQTMFEKVGNPLLVSFNWWVCLRTMLMSVLVLGLRPANERRRYKVTPSLIGWAQT